LGKSVTKSLVFSAQHQKKQVYKR